MLATSKSISEQIIWDAYDHGSRQIHIAPTKGRYEIRYRDRQGMEKLSEIGEDTFKSLDQAWREISSAIREDDMRRLYLNRDENDALQVQYQKMETVAGPRITLRLWHPLLDVLPLEKIVSGNEEVLKTFKDWASRKHGLIVLSGANGSGKTTTFYSMLNEMKKTGSEIFTIENPVEVVIDGINQIELARKTAADLEATLDKVYYSDPDVIGLGLGNYQGLENLLVSRAISAASTGHVTLLQLKASSTDEALQILKSHADVELDPILVGICHQKLVSTPKGIRAQYSFLTR